MRLDKYLKVARILKKRTLSKQLADEQRVLVNGKVAKPAHDVKIGDVLTVQFGNKEVELRILNIVKQANKHDAELLYEIIAERELVVNEQLEN